MTKIMTRIDIFITTTDDCHANPAPKLVTTVNANSKSLIFLHASAFEVILCQAIPQSYAALCHRSQWCICRMLSDLETHAKDIQRNLVLKMQLGY